jgi:hypothetical protein
MPKGVLSELRCDCCSTVVDVALVQSVLSVVDKFEGSCDGVKKVVGNKQRHPHLRQVSWHDDLPVQLQLLPAKVASICIAHHGGSFL